MDNFIRALEKTLKWEGVDSDDKNDRGGRTRYGISKQFIIDEKIDLNFDGKIDANDIVTLDKKTAIKIYKKYFWDKLRCDEMKSFLIQRQVFDMGVNLGRVGGTKIIQRCLNTLGNDLIVDGILGSKTINAVNKAHSRILNNMIVTERRKYYLKIVENNSTQEKFLKGWINRTNDFYV